MKKLVFQTLTLFLVFLVHACHGYSKVEEEFAGENYMVKQLSDELHSEQGIDGVDMKTLEDFLKSVTHYEINKLKRDYNEAQVKLKRKNKNHKPKHLVIKTNCDSVCVKTDCYAVMMQMENPMSRKAQEMRWQCKQDCGDKCHVFLKHCYECYKEELKGDCAFKQGVDDNIKLACHDKIKPCLLKRIKADGLIQEENGLVITTNDMHAGKIDLGKHKPKWVKDRA